MTTTDDVVSLPTAAIPQRRVVRERSVRRGRLGVAVALMAVCALGAVALFGYVSRTQPYLAIARDVPVGGQITAADLATVHLNPDPGIAGVSTDRVESVVGKYASVALLSGTLLNANALVDKPFPAPGEQVVGISLKAGQMPSAPLRPGANVLLVSTEEATQDKPTTAAPTIRATVVHVIAGARDGTATVSVAVRESDGPVVARLAAQGRLVLTMTSGS
ncbi:SAF domain-containing protein [Micromonospora sp. WMMD1102]|uniref:SAF domain-containing protein n=1 Tax=Micromonospora sp. WMMD1102 TaxID=3016105 RepID=UPI0024157437|nr:SAF domain-containing protein [Micromonospora sp. WMMD1102]MDG4784943.1 SAF domain-containing protein [Micromonospora sp. WMMD1102]